MWTIPWWNVLLGLFRTAMLCKCLFKTKPSEDAWRYTTFHVPTHIPAWLTNYTGESKEGRRNDSYDWEAKFKLGYKVQSSVESEHFTVVMQVMNVLIQMTGYTRVYHIISRYVKLLECVCACKMNKPDAGCCCCHLLLNYLFRLNYYCYWVL